MYIYYIAITSTIIILHACTHPVGESLTVNYINGRAVEDSPFGKEKELE